MLIPLSCSKAATISSAVTRMIVVFSLQVSLRHGDRELCIHQTFTAAAERFMNSFITNSSCLAFYGNLTKVLSFLYVESVSYKPYMPRFRGVQANLSKHDINYNRHSQAFFYNTIPDFKVNDLNVKIGLYNFRLVCIAYTNSVCISRTVLQSFDFG